MSKINYRHVKYKNYNLCWLSGHNYKFIERKNKLIIGLCKKCGIILHERVDWQNE